MKSQRGQKVIEKHPPSSSQGITTSKTLPKVEESDTINEEMMREIKEVFQRVHKASKTSV